jgi:hypothetical protein
MRLPRLATSLTALACVAALGLGACGDDDSDEPATTGATVAAGPDLERYCELVTELDRRSNAIFDELGAGGVPTEEELAAAQLRVLEENAELIEELGVVVPDEIREDLELSVESAQERAEAGDATEPPPEVVEAGTRLQEFRRENCPGPGGA